eukprot:6463708-Lingulodinium_polyedra.AAC.1
MPREEWVSAGARPCPSQRLDYLATRASEIAVGWRWLYQFVAALVAACEDAGRGECARARLEA